jgi:hypothetical protein
VGPYYVPPWFFQISPISGTKAKVIFDDADVTLFKTWQEQKKHNHDRIGYVFGAMASSFNSRHLKSGMHSGIYPPLAAATYYTW